MLGIPFDFTAKPVVVKPTAPRETVRVEAVRPDRDALEIRFPRVEGYRVELPEERLTAKIYCGLGAGLSRLCEQVVGRALRRQSYDLNEEGYSAPNTRMCSASRSISRRSR